MRIFFFSSRRRHTRYWRDWSSDVCSSDLTWPQEHRNEMLIRWCGPCWLFLIMPVLLRPGCCSRDGAALTCCCSDVGYHRGGEQMVIQHTFCSLRAEVVFCGLKRFTVIVAGGAMCGKIFGLNLAILY